MLSPAMIRGMSLFDRDKNSATRGANFSAGAQRPLDGRAIIRQIDNPGGQKDRIARRRWSQQFDGVLRGDGAWRAILFCVLHQMIGCRPIAMTIEQRADDAAIQNPIKSFVFFLWFPFSNDFAVFRETSDMQSMRVRRSATPARVVRSKFFLK